MATNRQTKGSEVAHSDERAIMPRLVRYKEAAKLLGVSVKTVRRWVDAGELPRPVEIRGVVALVESELVHFIQRKMNSRQAA